MRVKGGDSSSWVEDGRAAMPLCESLEPLRYQEQPHFTIAAADFLSSKRVRPFVLTPTTTTLQDRKSCHWNRICSEDSAKISCNKGGGVKEEGVVVGEGCYAVAGPREERSSQFLNNECTKGYSAMAATAKHELRASSRKFASSQQEQSLAGSGGEAKKKKQQDKEKGEEDNIAAIAKQISDHAEAIYQSWKSRGLAPTEILNCSSGDNSTAPGKDLDEILSCTLQQQQQQQQANSQLEKLVMDFVVEDKAKQQEARLVAGPTKLLPSSIQLALQKFEGATQNTRRGVTLHPKSSGNAAQHHNEVLLETIEAAASCRCAPKATGKTAWSLKNKFLQAKKARESGVVDLLQACGSGVATSQVPGGLDDQVAREEKRLMHALKTGSVILDEPTLDQVDNSLSSPSPSPMNGIDEKLLLLRSVSTTRSKFERKDAEDGAVIVGGNTRWGPRLKQQAVASHPEQLTSRLASNSSPAAFNSSNPVRPFLTRGSVAERVLIFEKCPSELQLSQLDKRANLSNSHAKPSAASATAAVGGVEVGPGLSQNADSHPPGTMKAVTVKQDALKQQQKQLYQENSPPHTTLQRHVKNNKSVDIPRFYFPYGKPPTSNAGNTKGLQENGSSGCVGHDDSSLSRISAAFQSLGAGRRASCSQFHVITKACDLPLYWKMPLFLACGGDKTGFVEANAFLEFWRELTKTHHDAASRFMRICSSRSGRVQLKSPKVGETGIKDKDKERGGNEEVKKEEISKEAFLKNSETGIWPEDLIPLVQDVVDSHPGLTFLKEATEFHSRYVHTVVARIFYCVNRSWSGRITLGELRRSNLLSVIEVLEQEEDINQVTSYFSYEHFYVIYCKFWELDRDHDLLIDKLDLTRHNDHALSTRMIERIFSGAVTRGAAVAANRTPRATSHNNNSCSYISNGSNGNNNNNCNSSKMSYTEFVWFLLSEEDKNHPTAIEYWFRCMDLDGDGYLSMYELEYFYEEQLHRMEMIGIETLPFEDCLCQMLDMVKPKTEGKISLSDLKRCKMRSILFDTFFNVEKYLDHEQRDPFAASARDHDADGHELSDWDRFAAEEYELLVAEESGNDQSSDGSVYHSGNMDILENDSAGAVVHPGNPSIRASSTMQNQPHYDSCDSDDYAESDE